MQLDDLLTHFRVGYLHVHGFEEAGFMAKQPASEQSQRDSDVVLLSQDIYDNGHFLPGKLLVVEKEF